MKIKLLDEIPKLEIRVTAKIIEYISNAVVIKTILRNPTGNICIMSFDYGVGLNEKSNPFDIFVQVIEGKAEIVISGNSNNLLTGESIVVPAQEPCKIKAHSRFKIILTTLKDEDNTSTPPSTNINT
ncbi:MAG: cupin [Bacteroidetes bacterium HGW-Bacteroidetes-6]|jgi:quercetin dioxygenase-like cupin family protein|nr:MAG: cupin [Bacteroidetes bacterium HGW-Bacteroidetes-6]